MLHFFFGRSMRKHQCFNFRPYFNRKYYFGPLGFCGGQSFQLLLYYTVKAFVLAPCAEFKPSYQPLVEPERRLDFSCARLHCGSVFGKVIKV